MSVKHDITIKAGADYRLNFQFQADDDSETERFSVLIAGGTLSLVDDSYISGNVWYPDPVHWYIEDTTLYGHLDIMSFHAQLREYPEAPDYYEFEFDVDSTGYNMRMSHEVTSKIGFTHGYYDVYIYDAKTGKRDRLMEGEVKIIQAVTR